MNVVFFLVSILLIIPAAYFLIKYRSSSKPGDGREDSSEPKELTGEEQYRRREPL